MIETKVSIGNVKREISELVNRVAYGSERVVLTSRGKPKAVLIGLKDYEALLAQEQLAAQQKQTSWYTQNQQLTAQILRERGDEYVDVDTVLNDNRRELEERHDDPLGG